LRHLEANQADPIRLSLLQNSIETARRGECQGMTLKPALSAAEGCRKSNKNMLGFSPCGFCFQLFAIPQRLKPESNIGHLRHD
jgi:hypothetical protein